MLSRCSGHIYIYIYISGIALGGCRPDLNLGSSGYWRKGHRHGVSCESNKDQLHVVVYLLLTRVSDQSWCVLYKMESIGPGSSYNV